jgi:F0F1-type ATP synthase membrane subunit b/b'
VIATNAIHAAAAAADAICCVALRERSADGNHSAAVQLLGEIDKTLAATLRRALDRRNQAAYEARDIADTDAQACIRYATTLIEAARERVGTI